MLERAFQTRFEEPSDGTTDRQGGIGLRIEAVSKAFDNGAAIIRDFSAEIPLGQAVAVVGASGSGKSTLLHIMAGLVRPDRGQVYVLGQSLRSQSDWDRARAVAIGYVFQDSFLLPSMTVLDNLEMPMIGVVASRDRRRERAMSLLARLGLEGKASAQAAKLSGGERQRVAIARSVVNRPAIIVADEPTGNLDFENTNLVTTMLHELREEIGAVLVIATHDLRVASTCHRSFLFSSGTIEDRSAII